MFSGRKKIFLSALLCLIVAGVIGITRAGLLTKPPVCKGCNIIVISLDQVRAKSLPCFGYSQNTAPNLCAFASRASVFSNAYATASRTQDSHFSMVTGLYPSAHTMTLPYASKLPSDVTTLAELLKKDGYRTYFFGPPADPHLPLTRGLERGFDKTFDADDPQAWVKTMETIATQAGMLKQPSFIMMHTYAAHEPYMPDPEDLKLFYAGVEHKDMSYEDLCAVTYEKLIQIHPDLLRTLGKVSGSYCDRLDQYQYHDVGNYRDYDDTYTIFNDKYWEQFTDLPLEERARYTHALYVAQIHMLDRELGRFFAYLDTHAWLEHTVVVIVGDQGDEFFEHTSYSHGWSLYDEVLRVPFIVYVPNSKADRSDRLVSLVDIIPTVYGVIGKKLRIPVAGYNVFSKKVHDMIISEHVSDGAISLRTGNYTLIRRILNGAFQLELYDRVKDPGERTNIFKNNKVVVDSLLRKYKELQETFPKHISPSDPLPTWLKEEDKRNLIRSGYF